jgi:hypothetical protein
MNTYILAMAPVVVFLVVLCFASPASWGEEPGSRRRAFFDAEDRARIAEAAETDWGREVVAGLEEAWRSRMEHDLAVPEEEAGHFHNYFCPEHRTLLQFDWDRPHRHYCAAGDHDLEDERFHHPWIREVHQRNARLMRSATFLHIVTGEAAWLEPVRTLLLDYAEKYPAYEPHGHDMEPAPYGGRMFSQTLDEATWICEVAPAYAEAWPLLSAAERERVEEGLLRGVAETILGHPTGGNWQVWHNAGVASAAVALGDDAMLDQALNDPERGYHRMMEIGVTDEGWWDERSPCYHFYPLSAMVHTAEAVRSRGVDLYTEELRRMFTGPLNSVYADLQFPSHNDGWYGVSLTGNAPLYEAAALRFSDAGAFDELLSRCYAMAPRQHTWALRHGDPIVPNPEPLRLESVAYPDTGTAFLRSGPRTAALKFGPQGGGHGHFDKLSVTIHNGAEELVSDLGTPGYGVPDYTRWYRKTVAHATVTVDQRDQKAASGELVRWEPGPAGGSVTADCETAYDGVLLERSLTLEGSVLTDAFTCSSEERHTYDYVLILTSAPPRPKGAKPIAFEGVSGYERITDAVTWKGEGAFQAALGGATLDLELPAGCQVITGEAPGIPANPWNEAAEFAPVYPLIVRVVDENAYFRARWEIPSVEPELGAARD